MIAYICEQGAKISREGRRLVVTTQVMKRTLFIERLEQLLIFGNVQLTPQPCPFCSMQEWIPSFSVGMGAM